MASLAATFNASDKTTPGYYGPSQTALLLLDFHSMFVQKFGGPKAPAALKVATGMRTWAKSQGIQVIRVLIDVNESPFPTCKDFDAFAGLMDVMKTSGGEVPAELLEDGSDDDVVFARKPGYVSALKAPGLGDFLKENGIKSLVLAGLVTSGCVLWTAVTASDAEYVVTVISDGCADSGEGVHEMMIGKVLSSRGFVTTAAEFREQYANATGG